MDVVSEVLDVTEVVAPASDLGAGVGASCLTVIVRTGERFISLLNIDRLVGNVNEPALSA